MNKLLFWEYCVKRGFFGVLVRAWLSESRTSLRARSAFDSLNGFVRPNLSLRSPIIFPQKEPVQPASSMAKDFAGLISRSNFLSLKGHLRADIFCLDDYGHAFALRGLYFLEIYEEKIAKSDINCSGAFAIHTLH